MFSLLSVQSNSWDVSEGLDATVTGESKSPMASGSEVLVIALEKENASPLSQENQEPVCQREESKNFLSF